MTARRWSPGLLTAVIFVLGGVYLVAPFVLLRHRFELVEGVVRAVHIHPLDHRQVTLVYRFSFPIDDRRLPGIDGDLQAFGLGRCDIIGRTIEEPIFDGDDPLLQTYMVAIREGNMTGRRGMVYYRFDDPLGTARINLGMNARRLAIGIAMLLTPVVVCLGRLLMSLVSGTRFTGRRRPAEPAADPERCSQISSEDGS